MNTDLLGLAFAAGTLAALNPCGFAMLPAYLTLIIQRDGAGKVSAVARALLASVAMAVGFVAVFGLFGLLTVSLASRVQRYLPYGTVLIGILLVALGLWLITGRQLPGWSFGKGARWAPTGGPGSMAGYGVGYALASLSCTAGPFLAVTASSLRSGSLAGIVGVYLAYAAGLFLVVGTAAVAVALASTAMIERMRRVLPFVNRASGAVLVAVGCYVAYYGWFEMRLFGGAAGVDDPVIATAGHVQRAIAGWVYQHGAWPWLISLASALGTLGVLVLLGTRRRRRGAATSRRPPVDSAA